MSHSLHLYLQPFEAYLKNEEKSSSTVSKYLHDVRSFLIFAGCADLDQSLALEYKRRLSKDFAPASVNSMLAALNSFFKFIGRKDVCVRQFKIQRSLYCPEEKELSNEEYKRLVRTAENSGNKRLSLALQTICATGIRVSELKFITVDAVLSGMSTVKCKGKIRNILIPKDLRKPLLRFAKSRGIISGPIFITRFGNPLDRSNIWREMKSLCKLAHVSPKKVFPHNLRHLFARSFYAIKKDLGLLSDILGHSNINTTRIYTASSGAEHRKLLNSLNLLL